MNDQEWIDWKSKVERAARAVAKNFPDSEIGDLQQSIWVGLLEQQEKGKLVDPNEKFADSALYYIGQTAASKTRKDHLHISAQYAYRTEDIRALLQTFFDRKNWYDAEVPEDSYSELGSVALEMSADLSRAWDKLSRPHKTVIFMRFGLNQSVDSKKLSKACARIADILNSYDPNGKIGKIGSRKVISNAQAAYIIHEQDSGLTYYVHGGTPNS